MLIFLALQRTDPNKFALRHGGWLVGGGIAVVVGAYVVGPGYWRELGIKVGVGTVLYVVLELAAKELLQGLREWTLGELQDGINDAIARRMGLSFSTEDADDPYAWVDRIPRDTSSEPN